MTDTTTDASRRAAPPGVALAGATAAVSGVSVFVNSYGVRAFHQAAVYTTAKNLVAAALLAAGAAIVARRRRGRGAPRGAAGGTAAPPLSGPARWAALAYVAGVGGGLAFVLFFDGLALTSAVPAAFLRDTLVVWVALAAVPALGERLSRWNVAAIALLVVGQAAAGGGVGHLAAGRGQLLVLAATVLWAGEVVLAKRLLADLAPATVALTRMAGGGALLVGYLAATGRIRPLLGLTGHQLVWALATGALLACYVGSWMTALARARAVDVTSVLVASAIITALLDALAGRGSLAPEALGLCLVALGTVLVVRSWPRRALAT